MATAKTRKERLSIYLAKNSFATNELILKTENAKAAIEFSIQEFKSTLYVKKDPPAITPSWTKLLTQNENIPKDIFGTSSTVGAALVIECEGQKFILTFGSGYHLINSESIERDFGLRVTLNSVDPDKLRSLDKASYDHNSLNSRTQSPQDVDIFDLAIDSEIDLLYAVTGASKIEVFGSHVTGRDALTLFLEIDLKGIPAVLIEAIKKYKSKLPVEFEWVDNINRVRDKEMISLLDLFLDDSLANPTASNIWLGEPEIVDWESQIGYSFDLRPKTARHPTLELKQLHEYLKDLGHTPNTYSLKETSVHINNSEFQSTKSWSAYRCLYAEIKNDDHQFILRNGIWYKVDDNFSKKIDDYLTTITTYQHQLPIYNHDREEEYNEEVVKKDPSFVLMDKKTIKTGGSYDKLEFCDLIKDGTDLIHVKYYRSSNTLSHLFAQGHVSAETFIKDVDFRKLLNPKLPDTIKLKDPNPRPDPNSYRIVYAIATSKKIPLELPFFSKITLKNSTRTLRALDFNVEISAIDVDPIIAAKKKFKPKPAAKPNP